MLTAGGGSGGNSGGNSGVSDKRGAIAIADVVVAGDDGELSLVFTVMCAFSHAHAQSEQPLVAPDCVTKAYLSQIYRGTFVVGSLLLPSVKRVKLCCPNTARAVSFHVVQCRRWSENSAAVANDSAVISRFYLLTLQPPANYSPEENRRGFSTYLAKA